MSATHGKLGIVYKWDGVATNLAAEACTESGALAQITDTAKRLLNPNADIIFTDSGGANVLRIDHVLGRALFDANVTVVTAAGTGAYIAAAHLIKAGYLYDWKFTPTVDLDEYTCFQQHWKDWIVGLAGADGSAEGFFAGINWFDDVEDVADGTMAKFLVQLFSYDPDDDATGDHFNAWVMFNGFNVNAPIGQIVRETINFTIAGVPAFAANV